MENKITYILDKLIEMVKQAFEFRNRPQIICQQSRVSCEAILKEIYKRELGEMPSGIMFDQLLKTIIKKSPDVIPTRIQALLGTVQIYGNIASHPQDNLEQLDSTHAEMIEKALGSIFNWFTNSYLNYEIDHSEMFNKQADYSEQHRSNYRDLLLAALEDKRLTIEEYESILKTRNDLDLSLEDIRAIDKEIVFDKFGIAFEDLSDLLESFDLMDFRKYEKEFQKKDWVDVWYNLAKETENEQWISYSGAFIGVNEVAQIPIENKMVSLLGAWQGWYFQNDSKTYFTLFFTAINETEIKGISLEPSNPTWSNFKEGENILQAEILGDFKDDFLIEFKKTYLFKNSWSIDYVGVILNDGGAFEGEWVINSLNGPFNAMKTKSLLPVRIFNTREKTPIAHTVYLDQLHILTGTYLIQLLGIKSSGIILHILEINGELIINLVSSLDNSINVVCSHALYKENSKVEFNIQNWESNEEYQCDFSFSVDFTNNNVNGVLKDKKYKLRVIKGHKL